MYETNQREPKFEIINKFADYFNVSSDYLLCRTDDPSPEKDDINTAFYNKDSLTDEEKEYLETQLEIFRKYREDKKK